MKTLLKFISGIWKDPASTAGGLAAAPAGIDVLIDGLSTKDTGKIIIGVLALLTTIAGLFYQPKSN